MTTTPDWLTESREFWAAVREAQRSEMSEGTDERRTPGDWIPYGRAPLHLIPDAEPTPWKWVHIR